MSDELKLDLAREIYPDSKRARKESFTPTQWAGVERAWAWVEKHYQPKEPTVKQEHGCRGCNELGYFHTPECIAKRGNPWQAPKPTPPWTEAQREAALHVIGSSYRSGVCVGLTLHDEVCAAIAKVAPMFVDQNTAERMSRDAATREERFSEHGRQPTQADQGLPRPLDGGDRAHERGQGEGRGVGGVGQQAPLDGGARRAMGVDRGNGLADGHHGARPVDRTADDVLSGNRGGEAQPAPSPAPAGVPWGSMLIKARKELDRLCQDTRGWRMSVPADHMRDSDLIFDDALRCAENEIRTRDERIADLEREFDAYVKMVRDSLSGWTGPAWDIDAQIRASVEARNELIAAQATIATLTKERDEAREKLVAVHDRCIKRGEERDAALARVAQLTTERDETRAKIDKMHPRLDGLADFYKCAREACDGFNTDKPLAEALRLLRSGYNNVCEDAKMLRERVAELEKRGAVTGDDVQRVETGAVQFDDDWPGVFIRGDNALYYSHIVGHAIATMPDTLLRAQLEGLAKTLASCDARKDAHVTTILRKHSRNVRRITREEARLVYQLLPHTTWDDTLKALRAIGFEVES